MSEPCSVRRLVAETSTDCSSLWRRDAFTVGQQWGDGGVFSSYIHELSYKKLYHRSFVHVLVFHREEWGSTPGQSVWDLWWAHDRFIFSSEYFKFPLSVSFRHFQLNTLFIRTSGRIIKENNLFFRIFWSIGQKSALALCP